MTALEALRPMAPWEGPPLPFFMGIFWPWLKAPPWVSAASLQLPSTGQYLNEEKWSVKWSPDGFPTEIVVHRDARRS
jgi:hypothetical protein